MKKERWTPAPGQSYYYLSDAGEIVFGFWRDEPADAWRFSQLNCFKNREDAEEHKEKLQTRAIWKDLAQKSWGPHACRNKDRFRYLRHVPACKDGEEITLEWEWTFWTAPDGFCEEDDLKKAVELVGEEKVKKYVLELH